MCWICYTIENICWMVLTNLLKYFTSHLWPMCMGCLHSSFRKDPDGSGQHKACLHTGAFFWALSSSYRLQPAE